MAYTTIDKPSDYFDTKLHNGTGVSKTLAYDFEVDFCWTKMRNDVYSHGIYDSSRTSNTQLRANRDDAERGAANTVAFGNSSGVTLGSDSSSYGVNQALNDSSAQATYVAWAWKANGGTTTTNDASATSVGTIDSVYQANTTAGFSIVTYTGAAAADTAVAHGLGAVPNFIIVKDRDADKNWTIYHHSIGNDRSIKLNTTDAQTASTDHWNNATPTSTVFYLGDYSHVNTTDDYVAYCFAEKQGYSKFGSYTGTANADGPFVYTGFKPAWVLIRNTEDGEGWMLHDTTVDDATATGNPVERRFQVNETQAEVGTTDAFDFLSNGFKLRTDTTSHNGSGHNIIYMAFAEHPFVSSEGVPCTAR
jgi:hypothetical protein